MEIKLTTAEEPSYKLLQVRVQQDGRDIDIFVGTENIGFLTLNSNGKVYFEALDILNKDVFETDAKGFINVVK